MDPVGTLPSLPPGCTLIDSHCHLDMDDFAADRPAVLARAAAAGVSRMITIGAGGAIEVNRVALALADQHASVFTTVGIHPHDASIVTPEVLDVIARLARHPKVVAIGESGLDYHYDRSPRARQRDAFRQFTALARALALPLVVHLREADEDAVRILREERADECGGVIHCFSGNVESARGFLDLGLYLSFSGIVTFKSADDVRAAARIVPDDRLLVETDAPFLAPAPHRGRRNEPALVVRTAAALAELRGQPLDALAAVTVANTRTLFRLP